MNADEVASLKSRWRGCVWAHTLSDDEGAALLPHLRFVELAAGQAIWHRGDPAEHWVGMGRGSMKLCTTSASGKAVTFMGQAFSWVGEVELLQDTPRFCDAVTLSEAVVIKLPKAAFFHLLDTNPAFNRFVLRLMSERLTQSMAVTLSDRTLEPLAKVAQTLALLFSPSAFPPRSLELRVSQAELASYCNMSRSRLNAALRQLESEGLVELGYQVVTLTRLDALRSYCGSASVASGSHTRPETA
ncbi:Crp/Fnr family transcriptional regulator [Variovorax sp. ZS18.2.2]|uniref:Crp/Fnr family transcriptional regulator n=1 Tax=Variovorax sp. ZS18.2.2 TaxID=2971255 RepID=UPI002150B6C5|nr:Crp/Fnr family transcriptional regulator [Variovorax sp. ZS18.2.2]MCR6475207.1 Crp/Fnr family transcriptional regulator [Variovorax sp. ZS18.2.2]